MIDKSEEVMDKFAGQMKLCDFGADVRDCPDGPGCTGPGGTQYTSARMYSFAHWTTRNFVRDSLKALFPDMVDEIHEKVDPGEFGQESRTCRILCCFLFQASLMSELMSTLDMLRLLYRLPSSHASWVECDPVPGSEVRFKITGMPRYWKIFNFLFVFLPKFILWRLTVSAAMNFLLDTGGITDVIINTVALNFILGIDELLFESLTAPETRCLMDAIEGYNLLSGHIASAECEHSRETIVERDVTAEIENSSRCSFKLAVPYRLISVCMLTLIFVSEYYYMNCIKGEENTWISKPLFMPASVDYPILSFLFPWMDPPTVGKKPIWTMPPMPRKPGE
jgi:hypothetical protein